MIDYIDDHI